MSFSLLVLDLAAEDFRAEVSPPVARVGLAFATLTNGAMALL